ncbi:MAG: hypothetical protein M1833_005161 [Piccolia ochrophora]|nr:MAG: hypothetical protein M1833_005161 [Piccolia ochrophora]
MTEPASTGIGGDMFALYYSSETKKVHGLNGSGRSAVNASLETIRQDLGIPEGEVGAIPMSSVHAVTTPGAAAGWVDVVEKFGNKKLSLSQILAPAIELGEEGFPVSELSSVFWRSAVNLLKDASPNYAEFLKKDPSIQGGLRAPRPGEIFRNPTLAHTFNLLGQRGKQGFYEGEIAEALIKVVTDLGGHLSLEDLRQHCERGSEPVEPISIKFNGQNVSKVQGQSSDGEHGQGDEDVGVEVWECPPNGQGTVALIALGILEELEKQEKIPQFSGKDHNSAKHLHAVIEALRIAFADGRWWITDPSVEDVPTEGLLSKAYIAERAKLFDPSKVTEIIQHGYPPPKHSDTVYFAVTDRWGNGISFINSNYGGFGTGIIPAGCGFVLHNRGANFNLQERHPNVFAPKKRPYHTIIPAMITNPSDGSLHTVYGVMGGFMQPQGHVQVLLNMLAFKYNPQAALDAPRICIGAGMPDEGDVLSRNVFLEEGIGQEVVEELRGMGHEVEMVTGWARGLFGRGQVIRVHADDGKIVYSAGSDPRGDGAAVAC